MNSEKFKVKNVVFKNIVTNINSYNKTLDKHNKLKTQERKRSRSRDKSKHKKKKQEKMYFSK